MYKPQSIVIGTDAPLTPQLYTETDSNPYTPLPLTGCSAFSAKARVLDDSDAAIDFDSVTVLDAPNGKVRLEYATTTFTSAGTYYVQIKFTDGGGKIHLYPSDGKSLRLRIVTAA